MPRRKKRTLLIDGDIIAYQTAAAVEEPLRWDDGLWTLHADENKAKAIVDETLDNIMADLEGTHMIIALSDSQNFRYRVYPLYKSNRIGKRRPMVLPALKEHMTETYDCYLRPDLEGDDILGILATHPRIVRGERIIVSKDKDMKTIPCNFYDMGKSAQGIVEIPEDIANYWHMFQTLTGDQADGYPGCPKVGPVKATAILETAADLTYEAMWPKVVEAYLKAGLEVDDALCMARIARICRAEDYDYKKKEVKLWKPPL